MLGNTSRKRSGEVPTYDALPLAYPGHSRNWVKLGYNFPGLGPRYVRWLCVICGHSPASFSRYVAQMGPPGTANGRDLARKVGYDLSTKWAI